MFISVSIYYRMTNSFKGGVELFKNVKDAQAFVSGMDVNHLLFVIMTVVKLGPWEQADNGVWRRGIKEDVALNYHEIMDYDQPKHEYICRRCGLDVSGVEHPSQMCTCHPSERQTIKVEK